MPVKKRPVNRARRATPALLPAPVGGLNGRDAFSEMPEKDAFVLDNWFPYNTSVDTRGGSANHVTGIGSAVESLEVYTGAAGSKMFAFANGSIYNVTNPGPVGAAVASGKNSNRVTTAMFTNAGAQWLLIFSGQDPPLGYDGAAFTALAITGMTGSQNTLHSPHAFKGRIFLAQQNQLGFYYLAVGAIQGAATYFDLGQVSLKGGSLATIASFSQGDTGTGPQDYALFVTTEGEYILYGGTDPSNSATWALIGRYVGPPPIGRKGWFRFRSDIYFITEEGVMSFAQIRQTGEGVETEEYITAKLGRNYIGATINQAVHGWCGMIYPRGNMLLINVPLTGTIGGEYVQFAMNTDTNSWGRFRKLSGLCWTLFNRRAYFGTYDGRIVLADEGSKDNGVEIKAVGRQAWNTFANEQSIGIVDKQFHMASVVLKADGVPNVAANINVNFEDDQPPQVGAIVPPPGAVWNLAVWNVDYWAGSASAHNVFISIGKIGYVASLWLEVGSYSSRVNWIATRVLHEQTKRVGI